MAQQPRKPNQRKSPSNGYSKPRRAPANPASQGSSGDAPPKRTSKSPSRPARTPSKAPGAPRTRPSQSKGHNQGPNQTRGGTSAEQPEPSRHRLPPPGAARLPASIRVVHEDRDLLVVAKPSHMASVAHPDAPGRSLIERIREAYDPPAPVWRRPKNGRDPNKGRPTDKMAPLNLLQREASGLVVVARTRRAIEGLDTAFRTGKVHRVYYAVVQGVPGAEGETLTHQGTRAGKPSLTHIRVLRVGQGRALVQVRPRGGWDAQAQAALRDMGCPILGDVPEDEQSRDADPKGMARLALHLSELGFDHPATRRAVRYTHDAPALFWRAIGEEPPAPAATSPGLRDDEAGALLAPDAPPRAADADVPNADDPSWQEVATWYDRLLEERRSDHYDQLILPGVVRLLAPKPGERFLDVACGQGIVSRAVAHAAHDVHVVGVDASPELIRIAQARSAHLDDRARFETGDARHLNDKDLGSFDGALCVMALMNIDRIEDVCAGIARCVRPGGRIAIVVLHPAFRSPKRTSWSWDDARESQYRRVDAYLSEASSEIDMNPGSAGRTPITTTTYHRPMSAYTNALGGAGLLIDHAEEWASTRRSEHGPRGAEEDRARREIPLLYAVRAIRTDR